MAIETAIVYKFKNSTNDVISSVLTYIYDYTIVLYKNLSISYYINLYNSFNKFTYTAFSTLLTHYLNVWNFFYSMMGI